MVPRRSGPVSAGSVVVCFIVSRVDAGASGRLNAVQRRTMMRICFRILANNSFIDLRLIREGQLRLAGESVPSTHGNQRAFELNSSSRVRCARKFAFEMYTIIVTRRPKTETKRNKMGIHDYIGEIRIIEVLYIIKLIQ